MKMMDAMEMAPNRKSPIMERYNTLAKVRDQFVNSGRTYSRMTLPWILPESGNRAPDDDQHGWQSTGARLCNHLANKIVTTLFPPNTSHFKAGLTDQSDALLKKIGVAKKDVTSLLSGIEDNAKKEADKLGASVARIEGAKHLVITGNVTMYTPLKGAKPLPGFKSKMQAIPLDKYVCRRDAHGNLLEFITVVKQFLKDYSPAMQLQIMASRSAKGPNKKAKEDETVELYTRAVYDNGLYKITQAADNFPVGEEQTIKPHLLPWNVLRWNKRHGSPYGGGLVEDYAGAFYKIEFLEAALAKGLILMADIKYLVKHGATLDIDEFVNADTGEVLQGASDDITVIQLEKYLDLTPIREVIKDTERQLGQAFLMNSANRRDAERVTTYELRLDAVEMEVSLGGIYSLFAEDWQRVEALCLISRLDTKLSEANIEPEIRTGLGALGKLDDLDKMYQFTEMLQLPASWPEGMQRAMKWTVYADDIAAKLSMKTPWLKTKEEMTAEQSEEQDRQLQLLAAQGAAKGIPNVMGEAASGGE